MAAASLRRRAGLLCAALAVVEGCQDSTSWAIAGKPAKDCGWIAQNTGSRCFDEKVDEDGVADPAAAKPSVLLRRGVKQVDMAKVEAMFAEFDEDGNGSISLSEFSEMMVKLGLAPLKDPAHPSASRSKIDQAEAVAA